MRAFARQCPSARSSGGSPVESLMEGRAGRSGRPHGPPPKENGAARLPEQPRGAVSGAYFLRSAFDIDVTRPLSAALRVEAGMRSSCESRMMTMVLTAPPDFSTS